MEENELQQNVTTDKLVSDIHNIIEQGRQQAYAVANQVAVLTYWHIGRRIVEEEQHGKARAQYGTRLIKTLAEQLMPKYGSTFSKRNLDYFRQFYLCFNDLEIVNTRVHNLQIIETQIKLAKVIQIAFAECATVFRHQLFCQCFNQPSTILRTSFSMLFFFHYSSPNVPIGKNCDLISNRIRLLTTLLDDIMNIRNEFICCHILLQFILFHNLKL